MISDYYESGIDTKLSNVWPSIFEIYEDIEFTHFLRLQPFELYMNLFNFIWAEVYVESDGSAM